MNRFITLLIAALMVVASARPQQAYVPSADNLAAREQFRDAKFGIFIHWGLYAMLASGEWTMTNRNINYAEYQKLANAFYPHAFDAKQWVDAFKDAGAQYMCFTSRHHEGFSMFKTEESDYNIVDATPYGKDVVKMLADECHRQNFGLNLYYSLVDWWRDDYPRGRTGLETGRPGKDIDYGHYYEFMRRQLTELLTHYGPIGAIWFDGMWDQDENPDFDWRMRGLYDHIHSLQPACLVGNNHHLAAIEGEDMQIFERDLPGENTAGMSGQDISTLPLETCNTMNGMWGYKITDLDYKSADDLVRYLVGAAGRDGNLLLNIGPQPDGRLPQVAVDRLHEMGQWLRKYGESIYGTRGGDIPPHNWGVSTRKGDVLYLHITNCPDSCLFVPVMQKVVASKCLNTGNKVAIHKVKDRGIVVDLTGIPAETDRIIALTLK